MSQLSTVPACLSVFDAVPVFPLRYFSDHVYLCNLFLHNLHYLWRGGAFRLRCFFAGLTCLTASGAVTVRTGFRFFSWTGFRPVLKTLGPSLTFCYSCAHIDQEWLLVRVTPDILFKCFVGFSFRCNSKQFSPNFC